eukprot:COSAG02_NODE_22651_length_745_cov_0.876161_1_plen_114_part_10
MATEQNFAPRRGKFEADPAPEQSHCGWPGRFVHELGSSAPAVDLFASTLPIHPAVPHAELDRRHGVPPVHIVISAAGFAGMFDKDALQQAPSSMQDPHDQLPGWFAQCVSERSG